MSTAEQENSAGTGPTIPRLGRPVLTTLDAIAQSFPPRIRAILGSLVQSLESFLPESGPS